MPIVVPDLAATTVAPGAPAPAAAAPAAPAPGKVPVPDVPAPSPMPHPTGPGGQGRRRTRRAVQRTLWAVLGVGLVLAIVLGLRPRPVVVETAVVTRGTLQVMVHEDGRTRVTDRYTVSAPLAGTIVRPTFKAGDSVRQDAVVARLVPLAPPLLDPRARAEAAARVAAARAALSQAGSAVVAASAAAEFARRTAAREHALFEGGATSQESAERSDLDVRTRQEELASARFGERVAGSELRLAQAALARFSGGAGSGDELAIRAPVRGVVLRVYQESEAVVQGGAPVVEIGDPAALEAVVDVLTTDAVEIRPGAAVRLAGWGGESTLAAHVHRVEPSAFTRLSALGVEEQRVNVVIRLDEPRARWAALGDGYRIEASILTWEGRNRLIAPGGAVFRQGDGWAAYVVVDGRARLRPIEVGRRTDTAVEVLAGLEAGDRLVLYPTDNVRDGVRVRGS